MSNIRWDLSMMYVRQNSWEEKKTYFESMVVAKENVESIANCLLLVREAYLPNKKILMFNFAFWSVRSQGPAYFAWCVDDA